MSTNSSGPGGPSPFSEEEVASVTQGPAGDPELDELEAATIDATDVETPFEKIVAKARKLSVAQVRNVVESVLFVAPEALSVDQLYESTGIEREKIQKGLEALQGDRREGLSGLVLYEVAGGWQFRTAPESSEFVRRFLKVKPQRLTRAALETLAICAYRQPVTRPEIEDIRGVDSGAVLKALLDRRLIKIVGKKEEVGRPILYGTSREFLEFFALKSLSALPTLREFQELSEENQEIVEREAPRPVAGILEELSDNSLQEKLAARDQASEAALADPDFQKKLDAAEAQSEAALEELERAIDGADVTSKTAAKILNPPPPIADPGGSVPPGDSPPNTPRE